MHYLPGTSLRWPSAVLVWLLSAPALPAALRVSPAAVVLDSPETTQQLLVLDGEVDLTRTVTYRANHPEIVAVDASGLVQPRNEGRTEIVIRHNGEQVRVAVEVKGLKQPAPLSFASDILPILTKAGCNAGGCHGKAEGQAGFKLSVFGFDPEADFQAIVMEGRGRRIFSAAPEQSLLVRKAAGLSPHGGGRKIPQDSLGYRRLLRWLAEGHR